MDNVGLPVQALHQAQDLAAAKYKLVSTLPVHYDKRANIVDMTYGGKGDVRVSTKNAWAVNSGGKCFSKKTDSEIRVEILSYDGCYLGFRHDNGFGNMALYGALYGTNTSVFILSSTVGFSRDASKLWPQTPEDSSLKQEYRPQGMVACRSGIILICLWNKKAGGRSLGKVVSENEDFEIFMDKNKPLFVCPTYIAENINVDICVSDVGAVVVTDDGGMLRFRYQGNSPNFDPYGLCCDSVCNIIIADMKKDRIHVIDKDGGFLYYVMYEGIKMPRALCIDENDNVYVGEWNTDSVKVLSCKK